MGSAMKTRGSQPFVLSGAELPGPWMARCPAQRRPLLLDLMPATLPRAGGLQELLAQGYSQGSLLSGFPTLGTQTGKPLPLAKGKLPRSSTRLLAIVKVLTLSKYVCVCVYIHTHTRTLLFLDIYVNRIYSCSFLARSEVALSLP